MADDLVQRTCPLCGTVYTANLNRLKFGRQTTCSRQCSYKLRGRQQALRDVVPGNRSVANQPQGIAVVLGCATCSEEVRRTPSQMKGVRHGSVFCSRECHYKGRSIGATKRIIKKPYVYTQEGRAALIESAKKPKGRRVFHWLDCTHCGKRFDDPRDGRERKSGKAFCSLDCCNAHRRGENNPAWRGGHREYYGPDWRAIRRQARRRDNNECRRCGATANGRELDVHHIKPVSSFENPNDANTLENVVTLCKPCHMKSEWHGIDFPVADQENTHAHGL